MRNVAEEDRIVTKKIYSGFHKIKWIFWGKDLCIEKEGSQYNAVRNDANGRFFFKKKFVVK